MAKSRVRIASKFFLLLVAILTFANFAIPAPAQAAPALPPLPGTGALVTNVPTLTGVSIALKDTVKAVKDLLAAITATQTALQNTTNDLKGQIQTILLNAKDDPAGAAEAIQDAITGALPGLEGTILTQALALVSKVAGPICPIVGAAASVALPNVGLPTMPDYSLFGPLAAPVKQIDQGVSDALYNFYVNAIARLLAPVSLPPGTEALAPYVSIAQALLGLLRINWHTVLRPSDGGPTITRDTPAFLNLPMVLDVDRNVGIDICANLGLDLTTLNVTQQIDRVPLSNPHSQLDIQANLLGLVNVGYETPNVLGSHLPTMFETTTTLTQNPVDSYVVQPGSVFSQLLGYSVPINTTTPVTTGIVAKTVGTASLTQRVGTVNTPTHYIYKSATANGGTTASFWGAEQGAGWSYKTRTIINAVIQGYTTATPPVPVGAPIPINTDSTSGQGFSPQATYSEVCSSTTTGACNTTAPPALKSTETNSFRLRSLIPATYHTYSTANTTTACPTDTHITATIYTYGAKIPTASSTAGHAWVDTDGRSVTGCQGANATFPNGFSANDRLATWTGTAANTPAISKSGDINCPPTTLIKTGSVTTSNYLCKFPPANTAPPVITGYPNETFQLQASPGTWTPGAPNAPSFAYQWRVCDGAGANCTDIGGANTNTYVPTHADLGKTIRVVVTATNLDGSASATSAATVPITTPAPAFNSDPPVVVASTTAPLVITRTSNGSWGGYPSSFTYQWQLCDADGNNCVDIPGETGITYTPAASDQGKTVRIVVTGCNVGGCSSANSNAVRVPFAPTNTAAPVIKNGNTVVTGLAVNAGDHLTVTDGTWTDPGPFTYQWFTCDLVMPTMETDCTAIPGATTNAYTATNGDVGHRLTAAVRTSNANGNASQLASPTGLVVANAFIQKPIVDVPDGNVLAGEESDHDTTYIGGQFDTVGPNNGQAGAIGLNAVSTPTGTPIAAALGADTDGVVASVTPDGSGGYFMGGDFTTVRGTACVALAHITSGGTLDTTYCSLITGGEVRAVRRSSLGTKLLAVGGAFTGADGHHNLFFIDPAAATPTPLYAGAGDPGGPVNAITDNTQLASGATGDRFLVGGSFQSIGATAARGLAVFNVTAGPTITKATTFNSGVCNAPSGGACATDGKVYSVYWTSLGFMAGGDFNAAFGSGGPATTSPRGNAVNFSASTTNPTAWSPNTNGPVYALAVGPAVGVPGGPYTVYLGGDFSTVNGTLAKNLAEFGITISAGNSTAPAAQNNAAPSTSFLPNVSGPVRSIVLGPTTGTGATTAAPIYIGGLFKHVDGKDRNHLALFAPRTQDGTAAAAVDDTWQPAAGKDVLAMTRDATNLIVGGRMRVLGGVVRENIAEIAADGTVTAWKPVGTGDTVRGLARSGSTLYAGGSFLLAGDFTTVRHNLAAFDTGTGALTAWDPDADGGVVALEPDGAGGVYVGGDFDHVGGQLRSNLARITSAGAPTSFVANTDDDVYALALHGGVLYVGGGFHDVNGTTRNLAAAVDPVSGALTAWNPNVVGSGSPNVDALAVNGDGVYLGGDFTTVGGQPRANIAQVDLAGATTTFNPGTNAVVIALKLTGSKLMVGGAFNTVAGQPRLALAQLEADGTATSFNGGLSGGPVVAMTYSPSGLLGVLGTFTKAGAAKTIGIVQYGA